MVLLALELAGNATSTPSYTYTLRHSLTYTKATLRAIDLHAPSPELSESWTGTQLNGYRRWCVLCGVAREFELGGPASEARVVRTFSANDAAYLAL